MRGTDIQKYEPAGQLSFHSLVAGRNIYLKPPKPPAHCSPTKPIWASLQLAAARRDRGPTCLFTFDMFGLFLEVFIVWRPKLKIDIRPEFCPITSPGGGRGVRVRKWFRENQASCGLTPPVPGVTSPRIAPANMKLGSLMRLESQRRRLLPQFVSRINRTINKNLLSIDSTVTPPSWDQIFPAEELWRLLLVTPASRTC